MPDPTTTPKWTLLLALMLVVPAAGCACMGGGGHAGGAVAATGLSGTSWLIEEIGGRAVGDRTQAALRFDADRRVSGSTGCNTFTGAATIAADRITFTPLRTTRRSCEAVLMTQERELLDAMRAVRSFSIEEGGQLRLLAADGTPLVRLSRAAP